MAEKRKVWLLFWVILIFFTVKLLGSDTRVTNISADFLKYNYKKGFTLFYGNVELTQPPDIYLRADTLMEYDKNKMVEAYGEIYYNNKKDSVEAYGQRALYYRDTQYLVLSGNAKIVDLKETASIWADTVTVYGKEHEAFFEGNVRIKKQDLVGTSAYAMYVDTGPIFKMWGSPVVVREKDQFQSDTIVVHLKNKEVEMLGNVKGKIYRLHRSNGKTGTK